MRVTDETEHPNFDLSVVAFGAVVGARTVRQTPRRGYRAAGLVLGIAVAVAPSLAVAQGLFEEALAGGTPPPQQQVEASPQPGPAPALPGGAGASGYELNGYVRGALFAGKTPSVDAAQMKAGYGEAALRLRVRAGARGDAYGELRLRGGLEGEQRGTVSDLREAYVNLYAGPVDVRLGHQIIAWGRADGFNPTDNLTPRDMRVRSANEDDRRLGNLALRCMLNAYPLRLEGVWVPFYAPSRLPDFALPAPMALAEPDYPDLGLRKGIAAVRVHLELAGLEGSLSYLVGHATFPGIALQAVEADPLSVRVRLSAYRHQVVGFDFATTLGDAMGLRSEIAFRKPFHHAQRAHVPMSDLHYVVGLDREIVDDVSMIVQFIGRWVPDWTEAPEVSGLPGGPLPQALPVEALPMAETAARAMLVQKNRAIAGQSARLSHALSARVQVSLLHETLSVEALGYYNVTTRDYLVRPKLTYTVVDGLMTAVGAEVYGGPDDTLFGLADEILSAGFAELRATF